MPEQGTMPGEGALPRDAHVPEQGKMPGEGAMPGEGTMPEEGGLFEEDIPAEGDMSDEDSTPVQLERLSAEYLVLIEKFCFGVMPAHLLQEIGEGHRQDGGTDETVDGKSADGTVQAPDRCVRCGRAAKRLYQPGICAGCWAELTGTPPPRGMMPATLLHEIDRPAPPRRPNSQLASVEEVFEQKHTPAEGATLAKGAAHLRKVRRQQSYLTAAE